MKNQHVVGMQDLGAAVSPALYPRLPQKGTQAWKLTSRKCQEGRRACSPGSAYLRVQERMLVILEKGHEKEIIDIFTKWDLTAVHVAL